MMDDINPKRAHIYRKDLAKKKSSKTKNIEKSFSECQVKETCGSCKYINDDYNLSLDEKFQAGIKILENSNAIKNSKAIPPVPSPKKLAYRTVAKLAVRENQDSATEDRFVMGLFEPNSHKVVDVSYCPIHTISIGRFIRCLKKILETSLITPYNEKDHKGDLRYVVVRSSHLTSELMVTFVVTKPIKKELRQIISQLRNMEIRITSAHMNINDEIGNAIFSQKTERIAGSDKLRESLCDLSFEISPTAFFQINPWQAINVYRRIEQIVDISHDNSYAWDLYCGNGQIAMVLARAGYKVIGIEENPNSIRDAKVNLHRNELDGKVKYIVGKVEDVQDTIPEEAMTPEIIVTNPSRRGLAAPARNKLINTLSQSPKSKLIYVSCDVNTLARDLEELCKSGHQVKQIEAFDMFAQTDKLEWMAILAK